MSHTLLDTSPDTQHHGEQPLVSIIMPAYNAGRFIGQAIQSIVNQTYRNWELLIIDDASTDQTQSVVRQFEDARIHYHRVQHIGSPAGVRNAGLKLAQGELIAFLDADDLYFPETLDKLSRPLLHNPDLTSVYGFAFDIDEAGNPRQPTIPLLPVEPTVPSNGPANNATSNSETSAPQYRVPPHYDHTWESIITGKIVCLLPALMLRRSALKHIGLMNEQLQGSEDYEFYVRLYLHQYEGVYCLSDYVYQYRIHSSSLTKAPEHCQNLLDSCLTILHWMFNEAPLHPQLHAYKSKAYTASYRYLARERLLYNQPQLARRLVLQALNNPNISRNDFIQHCGPLFIRSFLPSAFDHWLVNLRRQRRDNSYTKSLS